MCDHLKFLGPEVLTLKTNLKIMTLVLLLELLNLIHAVTIRQLFSCDPKLCLYTIRWVSETYSINNKTNPSCRSHKWSICITHDIDKYDDKIP